MGLDARVDWCTCEFGLLPRILFAFWFCVAVLNQFLGSWWVWFCWETWVSFSGVGVAVLVGLLGFLVV